jgi:membrane-bound serine protease (ClpP class)
VKTVAIALGVRLCSALRGAWPLAAAAVLTLALAVAGPARAVPSPDAASSSVALWLDVAGPIGPATVRYIERGLAQARRQQAPLVVIALDTPGGLDLAMRQIVQALLASPIPVVVHVSPEGARAASAGTFLLYAAHVAAMAPATTLGAATPVPLSLPLPTLPPGTPAAAPEAGPDARPDARSGARPGPRPGVQPDGSTDPPAAPPTSAAERKSVHDAAAYIRGLAQHHGRNADWAERAVREAVSLTAAEALREGVIDLIADSPQDLLQALDGRTVRLGDRQVTLRTAGLERQPLPPRTHERLIATLTQPGVALLLLMLGIWGLVLEFSQPGFGVAGTVGAVSLLLALYALQMLPFNVVGLALLGLGLVLMVAEALTPGLGVLGLGGTAAFIAGGLLLFEGDAPGFGMPLSVVLGLGLVSALAMFGVSSLAWRARGRPDVAGSATLAGVLGRVIAVDPVDARQGWAEVQGVPWRVRASVGLRIGEPVRVAGFHGSLLEVVPGDTGHTPTSAPIDAGRMRPMPPAGLTPPTHEEPAR